MALYAPILKNTQPAYIPNLFEPLRIAWKLSDLDKIDNVKKINIKINEQSTYAQVKGKDATNEKSSTLSGYFVFNAQDYTWGADTGGWYYIPLSNELFVNPAQFLKNYLYMVQIQLVDKDDNYSEWSNVMITKPITEPTFNITSPDEANSSIYTATALFSTEENLSSANAIFLPNYETLSKYKFDLYENGLLKETSGEILLTNKVSTGELSYTFKYLLEEESSYEVKASYVTANGFKKTVSQNILVSLPEYNQLNEITLISPTKEDYANFQENAYIGIFAEINAINQGNTYELARAVTGTQFYETIYKFTLEDSQIGKTTLLYKDFTIESGISYSYQIRFGDSVSNTLDLNPIYFEYSYLYADGVQLKLKFNNRINSFKHTVLAAKTDTIGSKYPTISRNGNVYYAEFPITGTISWHMDNDETFFKHKTIDGDNADKLNGYYYKDSLIIPDKLFFTKDIRKKTNVGFEKANIDFEKTNIDFSEPRSFDTSLTHKNIYAERLFRQKVEEFLNNGEYKIFKSPTEGNFIVTLMNISMTPNGQLGRMIYDFSATAYEMQDYNINSLIKYGFLNPTVSNEQTPVIKDYKTSYYAFQYLNVDDTPSSIVSFATILGRVLGKSYAHKSETNRLKYYLSEDEEIISLLQFEVIGTENTPAWYSDENTPVAYLGKTETYILSDIQKLSFENDIYFDLGCRYNFIIQIKTPVSEEDE